MNEIKHNYIKTRGLNLHRAEIGSGPRVVIFVHGFPEIWYTWRHQMIAVANIGYRAIAPDLIGYGLSDPHPDLEKASFDDYVLDLLAILDTLGISKVWSKFCIELISWVGFMVIADYMLNKGW
ncbi:hypothetical protein IFM89_009277 [Coptis chinensis]|uniref:AB hydrolase-1 domain-containing protein n=1 Tax=Coptis chinensis TaxID=261450 RepID=A0A835I1H3_9MAGN|nr:hypothetical protein IFM89_009277 [Coptis chinensis]